MHGLVSNRVYCDPTHGSINSPVNGMCLAPELHDGFDRYHFTIDPDDNYRVIVSNKAYSGLVGRHLRTHPQYFNAPCPDLLRWHFRQAVMANVLWKGTAVFDHDLKDTVQFMGEFTNGPLPGDRMTFEIANRLAAYVDVSDMEIIE